MKLKYIKINNYKSYGEIDNKLEVDDICTIIGKNESGKSNIIEALSSINYKGMSTNIFKCRNRNSVGDVEISISISSNDCEDTILTFKDKKCYKDFWGVI